MLISSYYIMFYKFYKVYIVMIFIMVCFWFVIVVLNKNKIFIEFLFLKVCNFSYRLIE